MEIKTKYNVGDEVFFLNKENKIKANIIRSIVAFVDADNVDVRYRFEDTSFLDSPIQEVYCYPSKEALLEYIQSE